MKLYIINGGHCCSGIIVTTSRGEENFIYEIEELLNLMILQFALISPNKRPSRIKNLAHFVKPFLFFYPPTPSTYTASRHAIVCGQSTYNFRQERALCKCGAVIDIICRQAAIKIYEQLPTPLYYFPYFFPTSQYIQITRGQLFCNIIVHWKLATASKLSMVNIEFCFQTNKIFLYIVNRDLPGDALDGSLIRLQKVKMEIYSTK